MSKSEIYNNLLKWFKSLKVKKILDYFLKALFNILALIRGNVCTKSDCVANAKIRF